MAKAKKILKKFAVAVIATAGLMFAGNSLQTQAETIEPDYESFGSIEELPDGSMIGCDALLPEEAEDASDDETTDTDTATADADASVDVPSQDITDADTDEVETPSTSSSEVSDAANATEATDEDDWLYADADDKELVPEFKGDSVVESKSTVNVDDDDDWMYVDFDSEPEVKGDDIITPEEPMVPEEPQPQPVVPETPILTEPTVQPTQTPVVLGDSLWTAPKTGDTIAMIAIYIIATLLAAGVIVLNLQRQKRRMRRTRCSPMIRPDHLIDN